MHSLAERLQRVAPSPTIAMSTQARALKQEGHEVLNLSVGEPDFDTPEHIKQAAVEAMRRGETGYPPLGGTDALKAAIASKFQRENHWARPQPDQLLVSCGAKHSLYNACMALLNPGDEVIVPAPYWVSYPAMVKLAGAEPVVVQTHGEHDFKLSPDSLAAAITPRTKLLILNSPSNPTGMCYSLEELKALGQVLEAHPAVWIISDDIYEHIRWHKAPLPHLADACPNLQERLIIVNGVSKAYAMTGWRIGYTYADAHIIKAMSKIQSQSTSGACSIAQAAAAAALDGGASAVQTMVTAFEQRHRLMLDGFQGLPGIEARPVDGTFYLFPNVEGAMQQHGFDSDAALAMHLLNRAHIATVPGSAFGSPGHLRVSFAASESDLKTAIDRLQQLLTR